VNGRRSNHLNLGSFLKKSPALAEGSILPEEDFRRTIALERKRAQRSRKPVLLTLIEIDRRPSEKTKAVAGKVLSALAATTRETDVTGWYREDRVLGVMFTEIAIDDRDPILATIMARVGDALRGHLTREQFSQVGISFHVFPEETVQPTFPSPSAPPMYSDFPTADRARRLGEL
jgi:hypothetical protein